MDVQSTQIKNVGDERHVITRPAILTKDNPNGLGEEFFMCMKKHGNKIMQIEASTSKKETFSQVLTKCVRTALEMQKRGVTTEDIVCISSNNHLNNVVPFIATLFIGAKVASLDPIMSVEDVKHLLGQIQPKMIFASEDAVETLEKSFETLEKSSETLENSSETLEECSESLEKSSETFKKSSETFEKSSETFEKSSETSKKTPQIVVFGDNQKHHANFEEFLLPQKEETNFRPVKCKNDKDTAVIFFSSGTTGFPKGICLSHFTISKVANYIFIRCTPPEITTDIILSYASTYWISTINILTMVIFFGYTRLVVGRYNPDEFWVLINKFQVSAAMLAPTFLLDVIKYKPKEFKRDKKIYILTGGGPISADQLVEVRKQFPEACVYQGYGTTETGGIIVTNTPSEEGVRISEEKPATCGTPFPGLSYKVVDVQTRQTLGVGKPGELLVKCEHKMNGYYNLDSSDAFEDGWMKTGDVLYYDEDECFYYVDRVKEMFKFRTWHVQPRVIEQVLEQHPAVDLGIVVGIPHPEDGDHAMAIVVLKKEYKDVGGEEIEDFVNGKVDDLKKLRAGVKIVDEFPLTPSGKIKRVELRKRAIAGIL